MDELLEALDWSNRPIEFMCGHEFTDEDLILGDFGDHILVRCPVNQEDYKIYYDVFDYKKVLEDIAILEN